MKPFIKPLGVAELKVVKQKLARYEAGEIAHIENVMATEWRGREHRRLKQLEETFTIEEERSEENTRDLQSTERFELQQEAQKVIKSETKWDAGVEVSGSYGPVSVKAFGNYASSNSKEESEKSATNYAKEVTNKTINKVIEKVRKLRTTRIFEEFEEKNRHEFDNSGAGSENISGIYHWVDKYYRAKVVSYGRRLMYVFTIPEPAAFYIFAKNKQIQEDLIPEMPVPPNDLTPGDKVLQAFEITEGNYLKIVSRYNAEGVNPPPPKTIVIAKAIAREQTQGPDFAFIDESLKVPQGYKATARTVQSVTRFLTSDDDSDFYMKSLIGGDKNETNIIPVSVLSHGNNIDNVYKTINIYVTCTRTKEMFQKWQLETYNAIMNAYHKQLMDFEEKLAAAQIQNSIKITGRNPAINREIEREELKKACLMLWTQTDFNLGSGINLNPSSAFKGYPEIDISSDGWATKRPDDIQFLEKAFDWDNMMYEFHPYYWGNKKKWTQAFNYEDTDPLFESFLKAGAATIIVPVHLQASEAVLYFQLTGNLHPGGRVPGLTPPSGPVLESSFPVESDVDTDIALYNSYLEELSSEEAEDDIEKDVDISADDPDTWLIKVPTNLVWLQNDNPGQQLPNYEI